jgi:hypothetical protein
VCFLYFFQGRLSDLAKITRLFEVLTLFYAGLKNISIVVTEIPLRIVGWERNRFSCIYVKFKGFYRGLYCGLVVIFHIVENCGRMMRRTQIPCSQLEPGFKKRQT